LINQHPLILNFSFSAMAQMHGQHSFFILAAYFMQSMSAGTSAPFDSAALLHG
jgi:hypothetical protein